MAAVACLVAVAASSEPVPASLLGAWRITRVMPTTNRGCWSTEHVQPYVGTVVVYTPHAMRWQGQQVRVPETVVRSVDDAEFRAETGGRTPATFAQLGITARSVVEVDLQHEDMDITGASTEVPGDAVLLVGPGRIVLSGCGVYMEATKAAAAKVTAKRKVR